MSLALDQFASCTQVILGGIEIGLVEVPLQGPFRVNLDFEAFQRFLPQPFMPGKLALERTHRFVNALDSMADCHRTQVAFFCNILLVLPLQPHHRPGPQIFDLDRWPAFVGWFSACHAGIINLPVWPVKQAVGNFAAKVGNNTPLTRRLTLG